MDQIQRSTTDPLRQLQVNKKTTGALYGYNVPKDGHMVFKTNKSPEIHGKIGRGSECMIVSNVKEHLNNLMLIGEVLQARIGTNFNLTRESLVTEKTIKGSIRICTLMNILLRFMDAERMNDKRWFFRSVEAYYTGHKGSIKDQ